jgi:hypothetical protein
MFIKIHIAQNQSSPQTAEGPNADFVVPWQMASILDFWDWAVALRWAGP